MLAQPAHGGVSVWEVVASGGVNVRVAADIHAPTIGRGKEMGEVVRGHQAGEWIALADEPGYVMIANITGKPLMQPRLAQGGSSEFPQGLCAQPVPMGGSCKIPAGPGGQQLARDVAGSVSVPVRPGGMTLRGASGVVLPIENSAVLVGRRAGIVAIVPVASEGRAAAVIRSSSEPPRGAPGRVGRPMPFHLQALATSLNTHSDVMAPRVVIHSPAAHSVPGTPARQLTAGAANFVAASPASSVGDPMEPPPSCIRMGNGWTGSAETPSNRTPANILAGRASALYPLPGLAPALPGRTDLVPIPGTLGVPASPLRPRPPAAGGVASPSEATMATVAMPAAALFSSPFAATLPGNVAGQSTAEVDAMVFLEPSCQNPERPSKRSSPPPSASSPPPLASGSPAGAAVDAAMRGALLVQRLTGGGGSGGGSCAAWTGVAASSREDPSGGDGSRAAGTGVAAGGRDPAVLNEAYQRLVGVSLRPLGPPAAPVALPTLQRR